MVGFFKRFRVRVILRILFLSATIFGFFYFIMATQLYTTMLVTGFLIIYQVFALIRCVERTNQYLSRFFLAIKYGDFSQSFTGKELGGSFRELAAAFDVFWPGTFSVLYKTPFLTQTSPPSGIKYKGIFSFFLSRFFSFSSGYRVIQKSLNSF
jgi:hypothetical protein